MGTMLWIGLPEPPRRDPTPSRDWLLDMPLIRELGRGAERPCKPLSPPPPSTLEPPPKARRGQNSPKNGHPEDVSGYLRFPG